MPAFFVGVNMSEKSVRPPISPQSSRQELADHINHAFETSDIDEICQAIGAVTHLHDISDIAKKSGVGRGSVYRSFAGVKASKLQDRFECFGRDGFPIASEGAPGRTRKADAFGTNFRIVGNLNHDHQRFSGPGFTELQYSSSPIHRLISEAVTVRGKRLWETTIADVKKGEAVPAAPIAWDGLIFVGNAGGDFKGGRGACTPSTPSRARSCRNSSS